MVYHNSIPKVPILGLGYWLSIMDNHVRLSQMVNHEDRWSLDRVSDVRSWWNFHRSFWSMIPIIWHHLQVHQEPPHPPRLQEETWRTGGVLTGFLMLDLDETFTEASEWWSLSYDTTSMFIRNLHILQDSRERLGGQVESWQGLWCWILMKLTKASEVWSLPYATT